MKIRSASVSAVVVTIVLLAWTLSLLYLSSLFFVRRPPCQEAAVAIIELRQLHAAICVVLDEDGQVQTLDKVRVAVRKRFDRDLLLSDRQLKSVVSINPDLGKWRRRSELGDELAAFFPQKLRDVGLYGAIRFSGEVVFVEFLPKWE